MAQQYYVPQDIGGFGRLAQIEMQKRREERLDAAEAQRQQLTGLQIQQAQYNLGEIQRGQKIKSDMSTLFKNLPKGENRFTAGYKYLMEQGEYDLANDFMKEQDDRVERVWKRDKEAGSNLFNRTIGPVTQTNVKPVPGKADIVEATVGGKNIYMKKTADGFVPYKMPEGYKVKPKKSDYKDVSALRKEFLQQSGEYKSVRDAYTRVVGSSANPSPAGDLSLIFNYMKMLDPGSVVRESEFATAASAGSYGERVKAAVDRVVSGERLTPSMRGDFVNKSAVLMEGQESQHRKRESNYRSIAEKNNFDAEEVVIDITRPGEVTKKDVTPEGGVVVGEATETVGVTDQGEVAVEQAETVEAAEVPKYKEGQTATGPNGEKIIFKQGMWRPL